MLAFLFFVFLGVFGLQICFYLGVFGFFSFAKTKNNANQNFQEPISVIICAKNEAANLTQYIPAVLNQTYSNFEIVLINDCSHDNTLEVMESFKLQYPEKIKIVNVVPNEQFWGSKKYALTLGIKAATHQHLLFTDADCKPVSADWIMSMAAFFSTEKEIVLGYGAYQYIQKSFLNTLIRFETVCTALYYFSWAKIGLPYMGVGRNLAYTKKMFFKANGFVNHMKIKSGDDDLFINQIANKKNTTCCVLPNSFTVSAPKTTFKSWIQQKRRHITTASHYKPLHKFLLGLFYSSQFLYWFLAVVLLSFLYQWQIVVALVGVRTVLFYANMYAVTKKLQEKRLVLLAPLYEIFLIFVQMFIFIKNLIAKPTNW